MSYNEKYGLNSDAIVVIKYLKVIFIKRCPIEIPISSCKYRTVNLSIQVLLHIVS